VRFLLDLETDGDRPVLYYLYIVLYGYKGNRSQKSNCIAFLLFIPYQSI